MPLKSGYSRATVSENIGQLLREGYSRAHAAAFALSAARASFFRKHPGGALPLRLAFPQSARLRQHYDKSGHPRAALSAQQYRDRRDPPLQANPTPRREQVAQAARRIARFTGMPDVTTRKIRVSPRDDVVLDIGRVDGILYSTIRDGTAEKYIHRFARNSRPLLSASPDGKRLYLRGGAFTFTDRGIVDRRK